MTFSTSNTFKPHVTTAPSFSNPLIYESLQYCIAFQELKETASAEFNYHYELSKVFEKQTLINFTCMNILISLSITRVYKCHGFGKIWCTESGSCTPFNSERHKTGSYQIRDAKWRPEKHSEKYLRSSLVIWDHKLRERTRSQEIHLFEKFRQ